MPLLLGLYWLMPPTKVKRRGDLQWVVLEELEMGLHPRAISVVMLMVLELVARGYRVCLSTHSPQVLDAIWALHHLKASGAATVVASEYIRRPPSLPNAAHAESREIGDDKNVKVFYFDAVSGRTKDISDLDPRPPKRRARRAGVV